MKRRGQHMSSTRTIESYFIPIKNTNETIVEMENLIPILKTELVNMQGFSKYLPSPLSFPGLIGLAMIGIYTINYVINEKERILTRSQYTERMQIAINSYNDRAQIITPDSRKTCGSVWPTNDLRKLSDSNFVSKLDPCITQYKDEEDCLLLQKLCRRTCIAAYHIAMEELTGPMLLLAFIFTAILIYLAFHLTKKFSTMLSNNNRYFSLNPSIRSVTDPLISNVLPRLTITPTTSLSGIIIDLQEELQRCQERYSNLVSDVPTVNVDNTYFQLLKFGNHQSHIVDGIERESGQHGAGQDVVDLIQGYVRGGTEPFREYHFNLFSRAQSNVKNLLSFDDDVVDKLRRGF